MNAQMSIIELINLMILQSDAMPYAGIDAEYCKCMFKGNITKEIHMLTLYETETSYADIECSFLEKSAFGRSIICIE